MITSCPRRVSSATPAGVVATRYSLFLISVGMPTRMILFLLFSKLSPAFKCEEASINAQYFRGRFGRLQK
ncbi:Uncharacterised protein [Mycobacteroides abscessus subsp. abscessus]|nr:Uncharacterised protein [Mycobacteroides abscessus subsp. abscessus]